MSNDTYAGLLAALVARDDANTQAEMAKLSKADRDAVYDGKATPDVNTAWANRQGNSGLPPLATAPGGTRRRRKQKKAKKTAGRRKQKRRA